jgi:hypothetical protein
MTTITTYRNVTYYRDRSEAQLMLTIMGRNNPQARLVEYERGFAIQQRKSGKYFNVQVGDFV